MNLPVLCGILLLAFLDKSSSFVVKRNETDLKSKIYGGQTILEGHVPYHVILKCYGGDAFCGGALVTPRHVLTAAHCALTECDYYGSTVTAGTIYRKSGGQEIKVKNKYVYSELFRPYRYGEKDDIAILELEHPFTISDSIATIPLTSVPPVNNEKITITGFGKISPLINITKASDNLKMFNTTVLDQKHCNEISVNPITESDFCDKPVPGTGVCKGDSGGPVVNEKGKLIGIASRIPVPKETDRIFQQCSEGYPTVYTSVYHHLSFINKYLKQNNGGSRFPPFIGSIKDRIFH